MNYDVIIIGAGPAGLMAAYQVGAQGLKTLLIDKNEVVGRKLLVSGSKQCNLTSKVDPSVFLEAYGQGGPFLKHALKAFDCEALMSFFEGLHVPLLVREDDKVFPKSLNAEDVVNALQQACLKKGVKISLQNKCLGIEVVERGFKVITSKEESYSQFVILATGGAAYPHLGSSGDGYVFAQKLGLAVVNPKPALTPVFIKDFVLAELSGLSFQRVCIDIVRGGATLKQVEGDLLLTHFGLSGPVILNNARDMADGDTLRINFTGVKNHAQWREAFKTYQENTKQPSLRQFLEGYGIPKRFTDQMLARAGIEYTLYMSQWTKEQREKLFDGLLKQAFVIDHLGDFRVAMVTAGGVSREEIQSKTMESKNVPGLFLIGEVADVDGDTGGFNIQAAMSMAVLAAKQIEKKRMKG
jgi:hypothetical protein